MKVWITWAYDNSKKRADVRTVHKTKIGAKSENDKYPNNRGFIVPYPVKD